MGDESLVLTDLIEIEMLQKIQDAFSNMVGVAALTTDANGVAVTEGTNFSDFCINYTRQSEKGCERCSRCDQNGARMTMEKGKAVTYYCHAGLVDFAAPIMADNKLVGCFIGGQVLPEALDEERILRVADELGIDPQEYLEAARKIKIVPKQQIEKAADFLNVLANVLSSMAYNKYSMLQANIEIEKAANMKSDFLANMSHEIRTPMNAVIGMAEMALREEMTPTAREYINQIKASGKTLLAIINDILDFSKIESGKLDILPVEYEPMSIVNDISNIIMTRIENKPIELILDIDPNVPNMLLGDNIRIKQIIVNLANNAVKFTQQGKVELKIGFERIHKDKIEYQISVEDTGIGIKQQDMDKLFKSFQQVDSKRNRNIEGTGLGLAICKQLISLMDGRIWVESQYGKGSKFSFRIPQKVIDSNPSIVLKENKKIAAAGLIANPYIREQLMRDAERLGVSYMDIADEEKTESILDKDVSFLFIDEPQFSSYVEFFVKNNPQITSVLLVDFKSAASYDISNLLVVKKPLYALNLAMIFNHEEVSMMSREMQADDFEFIAPDANILIVDDNLVNLTVAEGLLRPLKMNIDTALSGQEAIGKISVKKYDIVFMDHMMPEVDGVETTHIIRRFHPEYDEVPIIALTANAVSGVADMFIHEGMNDFIAKPIELKMLVMKVKKWLSPSKIQRIYNKKGGSGQEEKSQDQEELVIGDLDTKEALRLLGTKELFWKVLKDYYRVIGKKAGIIHQYKEDKDWQSYTIEVHALKSSSKQIGAMDLSERAKQLEKAGNILRELPADAQRTDDQREEAQQAENYIMQTTDAMLKQYMDYETLLRGYFEEEQSGGEKDAAEPEVLRGLLSGMHEAAEDLDMDKMEEMIEKLNQYQYSGSQAGFFEKLQKAVEEMDVDTCMEIAEQWSGML